MKNIRSVRSGTDARHHYLEYSFAGGKHVFHDAFFGSMLASDGFAGDHNNFCWSQFDPWIRTLIHDMIHEWRDSRRKEFFFLCYPIIIGRVQTGS